MLPPRSNFFLGVDPGRWRDDVPTYREVVYPGLYEGTDLVYRLAGGRLKYEFVLHPGADPGAIRLTYEGIDALAVDRDGVLVASTPVGELRDTAPVSWQGADPIVCRFALVAPASVTFDCPGRDPARPLVIDPLVWATYLGGSAYDDARAVAVDGAGNVYVTGQTRSTDFPTTPGAYNRTFGGAQFDAFVAKYDPTGNTLLYATYLGGTGNEIGLALAVDASGDAFVGGQTASANFPTTAGAPDRVLNGSNDAFLAKLDPAGGTLLYSTFLGGVTGEAITGLLVDASGNAYVAGTTGSPDFPTTAGAFSRTYGGSFFDVFVAAFDPAGGSLLFSTLLGGDGLDNANGLARDASGNLYVVGGTSSTNFPATAGAYSNVMNGTSDAFVAKFNPTGSALLYATFLGGTGGAFDGESANAIAVDASGDAYVAGTTTNLDFPTTPGAFNRTYGGATDGFVAKLNPAGSALVFSTYLGGVKEDDIFGIAIDGGGRAIVAGYTNSSAFPTTAGADNATFLGGPYDAFLTKLDGAGGALAYSTFLGGRGNDLIYGFTLDPAGSAYVVGTTNSTNFPATAGAANTTYAGAYDAFVAKLELGFPVVLATTPPGLQVEFDGNRVVAPHSFLCDLGSSHTVLAPSPQDQSSRRYVFNAWSDSGAQTHTITCTGPRTLTANFVASEYEMTIASAPPNLLVNVDGPQVTAPYSLWCVIGSSHTLDVPSPQSGGSTRYVFASWSDGGAQFHGITCDAPRTIIASFDIEYQVSVTA
ncbi:MAG TPA: SBBP repeat-containing protein, partial [Thermoplasmata archaeon]|nr:SBBP repeat-containing protein [Thermoplasmata archaeon]